ncbi:hypothetical protein JD844_020350 [Phrynosoma platyrhinos]|uniref:WD repeat and HMG-box DNA-binding protein 1 n=1 Tax=Phrynosoma platyrhinos TaxID=52577 RepID=A0ABQ7SSK0_PHRPL|nr:hypothetical protein JD844_020350 [Phrynosoma platyrhinos]
MPSSLKPMRYGHTEGRTDVCFDDTGSCIVTCGSDGDVRIWESLDDDDPKSINVGEKAYSFALKNGKLITAVSNNTVQIHTFPEGVPDGILTRFTMNANHVVFNVDGSKVAAGSSDFMVKIVEIADSSQQKTFRGHDAPVLSVSFDPKDTFLASASCDGSVRVWKISEQTCETSWPLLKKCNDVVNAKSICRLSWQPKTGKVTHLLSLLGSSLSGQKLLAIPVEKVIKLYRRETWHHQLDLTDDFITQVSKFNPVVQPSDVSLLRGVNDSIMKQIACEILLFIEMTLNVVAWSPCGQYVAGGSIDGRIAIWNMDTQECLERVKHEKGYTICGLAWHPKGGQIAYTDMEGNLGLIENVCDVEEKKSNHTASAPATKDYDDLFDEDDNEDFLNGDLTGDDWGSKAVRNDEDEDDDLMMASGRPRNKGAIIEDDENSLDGGLLKANSALDKEDDEESLAPIQPLSSTQRPFYDGPVWNSVGIIRCYNDEQDNAIDIEFHDTAIHHAMHLPNSLNHTMADLSSEAILLACDSTEELARYTSFSNTSEWSTTWKK